MKSAQFFFVILWSICFSAFAETYTLPDDNLLPGHIPSPQTGMQKFIYIDLGQTANMGFYDSVAGDNKGGWADFGPNACLKNIPTGVQTFLDGLVPFKIIDPAENNAKSILVLNGPQRETAFPVRSPKIPVNNKLQELYFLHTTMYA